MDILYLLVPMSVFAMLGILGVFAWALRAGQFDEIDVVGEQILAASDAMPGAALDPDQGPAEQVTEESAGTARHRHRSPS
jgi:cbb3-type cytochrome oxidase maturation protein